jgi:hypothetical protein
MDISTNALDLLYLTNPITFKKSRQKPETKYTSNELKIFRKRIFEQTRDILIGKKCNDDVKDAFDEYVRLSIGNFRFQDKMAIIQHDYKDVKNKTEKISKIDYGEVDKLMYKNEKPVHYKITDLINVKITKANKKKMIIPRRRDYTIKPLVPSKADPSKADPSKADPSKASKSVVKKDNIVIRYDEKKTGERKKNSEWEKNKEEKSEKNKADSKKKKKK